MKDEKIDVLKIESDKKSNIKNVPLSFKIIAIILLLFIPVVFM